MNNCDKFRKICVLIFILIGIIFLGKEKFREEEFYSGVGEGYYEDVNVELTATRNRKGEIRIGKLYIVTNDTPAIGGAAAEKLKEEILSSQNMAEIDVLAGATQTSEGIIEAVKDALSKIDK
ncbi:MAG: FMN-binding protein [Fusobacteriaceae bacterium]